MLVYNYHRATGEYLSAERAHPNPLEPGNWLVPAFATSVAPPAPIAGCVPVMFADGEWVHVEDHRGEVWYRGAEPIECLSLGPVPAGLTRDPPPGRLARLRNSVRQMVVAAFIGTAKPIAA